MVEFDEQSFKEQMLEFVEDREEPFDVDFLMINCNQPISPIWVHDLLCNLEDDGQIVSLNHHYLSTQVLMRRWLKPLPDLNLPMPKSLIRRVQELLDKRPNLGYVNVDEFINDAVRDAVRKFTQQNQTKTLSP